MSQISLLRLLLTTKLASNLSKLSRSSYKVMCQSGTEGVILCSIPMIAFSGILGAGNINPLKSVPIGLGLCYAASFFLGLRRTNEFKALTLGFHNRMSHQRINHILREERLHTMSNQQHEVNRYVADRFGHLTVPKSHIYSHLQKLCSHIKVELSIQEQQIRRFNDLSLTIDPVFCEDPPIRFEDGDALVESIRNTMNEIAQEPEWAKHQTQSLIDGVAEKGFNPFRWYNSISEQVKEEGILRHVSKDLPTETLLALARDITGKSHAEK